MISDESDGGVWPLSSIGIFLIPLVYAWLLPRTGFYLTTPFFLIAYLLHVGERRVAVIPGTTAVITTVINLIPDPT